jgi:hypothetical protein
METTREEILAPYRADLEEDVDNVTKLLEIPEEQRNRSQRKMIAAMKEISVWLEELVAVGGDVRDAPPPPKEQYNPTTAHTGRLTMTVYMEDGRPFKAYPMSPFLSEPLRIVRGHPDVTGELYRPYNRRWYRGRIVTKPAFNAFDLTGFYTYDPDDEKQMAQIRQIIHNYEGPLNTDPNTWSEPWRTWYLESHSGDLEKEREEPEIFKPWTWW